MTTARTSRSALALGLAAAIAGCDEPSKAPNDFVATLAPVVVLPAGQALAAVAIPIDAARILVVRPPSESVLDTVVPFPAASSSLNVRLRVPLRDRLERLSITVELLVLSRPYYAATALVDVPAEGPGTQPAQPVFNLIYVGPGASAQTIRIAPRDTTVTLGDPMTMRVAGFDAGGAPLSELFVTWSSSSSAITIAADGSFTAPGTPGFTLIKATTPTGIADSTTVTFGSPAPASLQITGGNQQSGTVGTSLAQPLQVLVRGPTNLPFPGATVQFRALTGGSVTNPTVVTDAQGIARTQVTLGTVSGPQDFDATVVGVTPVTFTATALAGPAAGIRYVSGGGQIGTVGTALGSPLLAKVVDAFGNGVPGITVNWDNAVGSGIVGNQTTTSNAAGVVTNTFTLDGSLGYQAAIAAIPVAANFPVLFNEIGQAGAPQFVVPFSGDGQLLTSPSTPLPEALVIRVIDGFGNPIVGSATTWAVTAGSGSLTSVTGTNSDGVAQATLTPTSAGIPITVRANIPSGLSYTFTFPTSLTQFRLQSTSGGGQSLAPNQTAQIPVTATVFDVSGFPTGGEVVGWSVLLGQGSVNPTSVLSGSSFGDASTFYTASLQAGVRVIQAQLLSGGAETNFIVRVLPGPPLNLAMFDGDQQVGKGGTTLPIQLRVLVLDGFGNIVPGAAVTWTAPAGGTVGTPNATADQRGVASTTARLSLTLGPQQFRAALPSGNFLVFTLTAN